MFVDTDITDVPNAREKRHTAEDWLEILREREGARLRVYIGAAAGVGKTYRMLQDAHQLKEQGIDVVLGVIETHGRAETALQIGDLEMVPPKKIEYRGNTFEEMDVEAIIRRHPAVVVVDELAHTNIEGSTHAKRYQDVKDLIANGISVITAVNIQHIESLNDVVASTTGIQVKETVPDCFFKKADEIIDVDVSIDTLRQRLKQGKIYAPEKIEQALANFFRKGNLA
ncbi:MAG: sensor histidine kinase KdpD, partial [Acidobacteria bacterium]|nr:sensor histidine kinase KdpD [Acidobacteriota bacterium]